MIKTDGGITQIKGTKSKVLTELAITIAAVFKTTAEEVGEERAKELVKTAYERAFMSEEELEEEVEKARKNILAMLKGIGL